eukprot:8854921-Prorocentrum_lima.AAC.1
MEANDQGGPCDLAAPAFRPSPGPGLLYGGGASASHPQPRGMHVFPANRKGSALRAGCNGSSTCLRSTRSEWSGP